MPHRSDRRVRAEAFARAPRPFALALLAIVAGCGGGDVRGAADAAPRATAQAAIVRNAAGAAYYVDARNGNDGNPGTSPTQAFRTLAPLADVSGAGAIYLGCGGTWRQTLSLSARQLAAGATVGSYPSNCGGAALPRVTGADDFSGASWTKDSATGIWSRPVPAGTPAITRLFVDGAPMRVAQWPATAANALVPAYALTDAGDQPKSQTQLVASAADAAKLVGQDLANASVHVRDLPWLVEDAAVASISAKQADGTAVMTLSPQVRNWIYPTQGYFLTGKLWMLEAPGQFFHDTQANKLYLIPADAGLDVPAALIEGAQRTIALNLSNASLTVTGLRADMTTQDVVVAQNLTNSTLTQLSVAHAGRNGVYLSGAANAGVTLSNSQISDSPLYGIDALDAPDATISANAVSDTGTLGYYGSFQAAIYGGPGDLVQGNVVSNAAYQGIYFSPKQGSQGQASRVTGNVVNGYCLALSDCGALYTWASQSAIPAGQLSTVTGNQVGPAAANTSGTYALIGNPTLVAGVYLDDLTADATVTGNTVAGAPTGVFVHNGSGDAVSGNDLWLDTDASFSASVDLPTTGMAKNTVSGNRLVPASVVTAVYPTAPNPASAAAIAYSTQAIDTSQITSGASQLYAFSGNRIVRLQAGSMAAARVRTAAGTSSAALTPYSIGGWLALSPGDVPAAAPLTFDLLHETLDGTELQPDGGFAAPGWATYWASGTAGTFALASGLGQGCPSTCAEFAVADPRDVMYGPATPALVPGRLYSLRYDAWFTAAGLLLPANVSESANSAISQGPVTFLNAGAAGPQKSVQAEGWVLATQSVASRTNIKLGTKGVAAYVSNVSLRAVTGYSPAPVPGWAQAVQATAGDVIVTCASLGWTDGAGGGCTAADVSGQAVSLPVVVPQGRAALFLRKDSSWVHAGQ